MYFYSLIIIFIFYTITNLVRITIIDLVRITIFYTITDLVRITILDYNLHIWNQFTYY